MITLQYSKKYNIIVVGQPYAIHGEPQVRSLGGSEVCLLILEGNAGLEISLWGR